MKSVSQHELLCCESQDQKLILSRSTDTFYSFSISCGAYAVDVSLIEGSSIDPQI